MKLSHLLSIGALAIILGGSAVGCAEKGPAEKAGESLDDAMKNAQESVQDAAKDAQKAAEDAKESMQE